MFLLHNDLCVRCILLFDDRLANTKPTKNILHFYICIRCQYYHGGILYLWLTTKQSDWNCSHFETNCVSKSDEPFFANENRRPTLSDDCWSNNWRQLCSSVHHHQSHQHSYIDFILFECYSYTQSISRLFQ